MEEELAFRQDSGTGLQQTVTGNVTSKKKLVGSYRSLTTLSGPRHKLARSHGSLNLATRYGGGEMSLGRPHITLHCAMRMKPFADSRVIHMVHPETMSPSCA